MFKTIVVGVDGREGGRDAMGLAGRLALLAGGELVAVRALPFDYYVSRAGSPPYASLAEQDAERELEDALATAGLNRAHPGARRQFSGARAAPRRRGGARRRHRRWLDAPRRGRARVRR